MITKDRARDDASRRATPTGPIPDPGRDPKPDPDPDLGPRKDFRPGPCALRPAAVRGKTMATASLVEGDRAQTTL